MAVRIKRGKGRADILLRIEIINMKKKRKEEWLRSPVYTFVYSECSIKVYLFIQQTLL